MSWQSMISPHWKKRKELISKLYTYYINLAIMFFILLKNNIIIAIKFNEVCMCWPYA